MQKRKCTVASTYAMTLCVLETAQLPLGELSEMQYMSTLEMKASRSGKMDMLRQKILGTSVKESIRE